MIDELIGSSIPAFIVAVAGIAAALFVLMMQFRFRQKYDQDKFRLEVERQIADLSQQISSDYARFKDINHLILEGQQYRAVSNQIDFESDFLSRLGISKKPEVDEKLIFVLTPFHPEYDKDYVAIKDSAKELDFICTRGDEDSRSTEILGYIIRQMLRARVVIANISGRNPNVFYELGIAHAFGKQVVVVARSGEELPFNVAETRVLSYESPTELKKKLRNWIVHSSFK